MSLLSSPDQNILFIVLKIKQSMNRNVKINHKLITIVYILFLVLRKCKELVFSSSMIRYFVREKNKKVYYF